MAAPVVDRIEKDLQGSARVVRLDTQHSVTAELTDIYHIRAVPCILVFNGNGQVVYHNVGIPDPEHVGQLVRRLQRTSH